MRCGSRAFRLADRSGSRRGFAERLVRGGRGAGTTPRVAEPPHGQAASPARTRHSFVTATTRTKASALFNRRKRTLNRLLIVEDEPLVAFDNELSLRADGYEVVATVDRCADAIAVMDSEPLDLVLTDIALTGLRTGLDVARYAATKGLPVLFVSGTCPDEGQSPAIACLLKPYNERTLKLALEAIDRRLTGDTPGKLPPGLSFYAGADSVG